MNPVVLPLVLADADREYLRALVEKIGIPATMRELDMTRGVIVTAIAGINARRGSIEILRGAIERHRSGGATK